jgi:NTP pyrophosphatase (non-canonical NTP hydrolase)
MWSTLIPALIGATVGIVATIAGLFALYVGTTRRGGKALAITGEGRRTFNEWRDKTGANADAKGFRENLRDPRSVEAMGVYTANLAGEVSELWEAARAGKLHAPCDKAEKMREAGLPALSCIEEELADIQIRAMDTAYVFGVDLDKAVAVKHAFNTTRPRFHGNKLV